MLLYQITHPCTILIDISVHLALRKLKKIDLNEILNTVTVSRDPTAAEGKSGRTSMDEP